MTFNGKSESEQKYYEDTTRSIRDSCGKKKEDTKNLKSLKGYSDYCDGASKAVGDIVNNLEPKHGVTPWRIDSALQNGLSALGYAPQWALPTDFVHWEYPQDTLMVCNDTSNGDYNLYCKESTNSNKQDNETNLLRGVSDFYKNLQTAYQTVLSNPNLTSSSCSSVEKSASLLKNDYILGETSVAPDLTKVTPIDWSYWEKNYPSLISLPNCEETSKQLNKSQNTSTSRTRVPSNFQSESSLIPDIAERPCDLSIPRIEKIPKTTKKLRKNRSEIVSSEIQRNNSDLGYVNAKKLDVETKRVKNETTRSSLASVVNSNPSYWQDYIEMSGQYPGHGRPPVGTPPPQNVWNHLTMSQAQAKNNANNRGNVGVSGAGGVNTVTGGVPTGHDSLQRSYERVQSDLTYLLSEVSGLNMHPTGLSGATLNPAGFYTHPSMARAASHLTSQLTPQLAHTQAPPTWHTPTVPSKSVAAPNAPGNPLYSLQMLVDNRQNQNQYRNSPGSQSTLDLSATSEMAENYSRMTQDIPISLTARNIDKGSRNGNIISPPIPLNGETSSDSGISSSVPTPNSMHVEPVSLSTKDLTTPKITVKNFESNLKGVANLHDKIKDIGIDNFAQKVINLPPSVTIERVMTCNDKKDTEQQQQQQQSLKMKDTLSVIAQVPRNVLPVIVNLTSRLDKDTIDSPIRESSSERERKIDDSTSVRSPKNMSKRAVKKGVDSLLEKLEGGTKKLSTENIGSVIVTPVEEKDNTSTRSVTPERQKSKSPTTRDEDVVSPAFSNDDSNDQTKQRRKRKLEKPVRLSKDSKTEVEDMELEPTEPREPRICEIVPEQEIPVVSSSPIAPSIVAPTVVEQNEDKIVDRTKITDRIRRQADGEDEEDDEDDDDEDDDDDEEDEVIKSTEDNVKIVETVETTKIEENEPIKRRRSSEGSSTCQTSTNQRTRRKSSDDAMEFAKVTSPKGNVNSANPFNEVESELEKMFAGIVETGNIGDGMKNEEMRKDITTAMTTATTTTTTTTTSEAKRKKKNEEVDKILETSVKDEEKCTKETKITNPTDVTSTVLTTKPSPSKKGKKGKVRGGKRKISRSRDFNHGVTSDDQITPKDNSKKRRGSKGGSIGGGGGGVGSGKTKIETPTKKQKNKNLKTDGLREISYDSGSNASSIRSRGPVVHVEGPRDSPLSVQVVNAPREEEEEKSKEKRKSLGNGNAGRSKRLSHQNDLDYRGKVSRAGLFSSTLSSRYDAHTTDSTWVCVFCKQGPHSVVSGDPLRPHPNLAGPHIAPGTYTVPAAVLSDLFGPYLIGKERLEEGILSADEQEITTEQKKGSKNKRSLRYAGLADQFSAKMGKKKRNSVDCIVTGTFVGMTMLPGDEQRWEVWLHEQCALWAAGVYMAGGRVTGLQEAVWDSTKSICGTCGLTGANIGCVKRGCKSVTHYPCALTKGWLLDTNQYIPKCNLHRVT